MNRGKQDAVKSIITDLCMLFRDDSYLLSERVFNTVVGILEKYPTRNAEATSRLKCTNTLFGEIITANPGEAKLLLSDIEDTFSKCTSKTEIDHFRIAASVMRGERI